MTRSIHPLLTALLLTSAVVSSGCTGQKALIAQRDAELDSLSAANHALYAELRTLRDSLQFYDDIDSGQYYRDRRLLTQKIEELQYHLAVCGDGGRTIETLLVDDLFEPATATLTESGRERLRPVADTLKAAYIDRAIRVEGHADSTPIGAGLADRYPSNWELSADRAAAVIRFLVDEEGLPAEQIELAGFGASRPIARNDTAAGRRQNRRVRIAVMPP